MKKYPERVHTGSKKWIKITLGWQGYQASLREARALAGEPQWMADPARKTGLSTAPRSECVLTAQTRAQFSF